MGVVYEAGAVFVEPPGVLKVLPFAAAMDPTQLRRFQTEALAAAQLHHTHIVPVYSVGCGRRRALLRHAVHPRPNLGTGNRRTQVRSSASLPRSGRLPTHSPPCGGRWPKGPDGGCPRGLKVARRAGWGVLPRGKAARRAGWGVPARLKVPQRAEWGVPPQAKVARTNGSGRNELKSTPTLTHQVILMSPPMPQYPFGEGLSTPPKLPTEGL